MERLVGTDAGVVGTACKALAAYGPNYAEFLQGILKRLYGGETPDMIHPQLESGFFSDLLDALLELSEGTTRDHVYLIKLVECVVIAFSGLLADSNNDAGILRDKASFAQLCKNLLGHEDETIVRQTIRLMDLIAGLPQYDYDEQFELFVVELGIYNIMVTGERTQFVESIRLVYRLSSIQVLTDEEVIDLAKGHLRRLAPRDEEGIYTGYLIADIALQRMDCADSDAQFYELAGGLLVSNPIVPGEQQSAWVELSYEMLEAYFQCLGSYLSLNCEVYFGDQHDRILSIYLDALQWSSSDDEVECFIIRSARQAGIGELIEWAGSKVLDSSCSHNLRQEMADYLADFVMCISHDFIKKLIMSPSCITKNPRIQTLLDMWCEISEDNLKFTEEVAAEYGFHSGSMADEL